MFIIVFVELTDYLTIVCIFLNSIFIAVDDQIASAIFYENV